MITRKLRTKAKPAAIAETPSQEAPSAQAETQLHLPKGKLGVMIALLGREEGATTADLMTATGWQAHSVRGAIAGTIKKKLKLAVSSEKTEAGRVYRILEGAV